METKQILVYVNQALDNIEAALFHIPIWSFDQWEYWLSLLLEHRGIYDCHHEACLVLFMELGRRGVKIAE